jgi:septum formation topological specificity factor MinE
MTIHTASDLKKFEQDRNSMKIELSSLAILNTEMEKVIEKYVTDRKELMIDLSDAQADAAMVEVELRETQSELGQLKELYNKIPKLVRRAWGIKD